MNIRVGITLGDPSGVGAETVIKIFRDQRMFDMATFVLYGASKSIAFYKSKVEEAEGVNYTLVRSAAEAQPRKLNLVECGKADMRISVGESTPESGAVAVESLRRAVADVKEGELDVLVTAPVNKNAMDEAGFGAVG